MFYNSRVLYIRALHESPLNPRSGQEHFLTITDRVVLGWVGFGRLGWFSNSYWSGLVALTRPDPTCPAVYSLGLPGYIPEYIPGYDPHSQVWHPSTPKCISHQSHLDIRCFFVQFFFVWALWSRVSFECGGLVQSVRRPGPPCVCFRAVK